MSIMTSIGLIWTAIQALPAASVSDEQAAIITRIESSIELPTGAGSLNGYTRFYRYGAEVTPRGQSPDQRIVFGYYVYGNWATERGYAPGAYWGDSEAMIADGGCSVVYFEYALTTDNFRYMRCNGVA